MTKSTEEFRYMEWYLKDPMTYNELKDLCVFVNIALDSMEKEMRTWDRFILTRDINEIGYKICKTFFAEQRWHNYPRFDFDLFTQLRSEIQNALDQYKDLIKRKPFISRRRIDKTKFENLGYMIHRILYPSYILNDLTKWNKVYHCIGRDYEDTDRYIDIYYVDDEIATESLNLVLNDDIEWISYDFGEKFNPIREKIKKYNTSLKELEDLIESF